MIIKNKVLNTRIILLVSCFIFISLITFLRSNYLHITIVDDAYIFFRYAENIVNGHGLVWNISEQPVEGYSSFLYLTVIILAKFLSFDLELFAIIFGIFTSSITLLFTFLLYTHLYSDNQSNITTNIITIIIIAVSPAFLYWSVAGMETSFYSMSLIVTVYTFLTRQKSNKANLFNGLLFGLLCVLRFEAVIFFLAALYFLLNENKSYFKIQITRSAILFASGFTLIFGTYFIWRWMYFGFFLPNTFYAKTGAGLIQIIGGLSYTILAFRILYGAGWIPIFAVMLFFRKTMLNRNVIFVFTMGFISIISTILIGGDHFGYGRFVLPVLPLLFVIFPPSVYKLLNTNIFLLKAKYVKIAFIFLFIFIVFCFKPIYLQAFNGLKNLIVGKKDIVIVQDRLINDSFFEWQHAFIVMGQTLNKIASQDDYIAAIPIGAIGYYSKINVIDMVGIVDPVIAHDKFSEKFLQEWQPGHNKGNGKYVLSRKPKFIQLVDHFTHQPKPEPGNESLRFKSVSELWNSEEFHSNYEFYPIEVENGWFYNLYRRK